MTDAARGRRKSDRFVAITGCSGGGKSSLVDALAARGIATVAEPGRRLLEAGVLPWCDPTGFVRDALAMAQRDYAEALERGDEGWVFFDRGLIDAASALQHLSGEPVLETLALAHRYHDRVFIAPPWPEIYVMDSARRHGFDRAVAEYDRLRRDIPALGYDLIELPRIGVAERVAFVLDTLAA